MAEPEDLAKGIAENIGVMPIVTGAGKMGGSLMDLLGSLLGGSKQAPARAQPAPPPAQGGGLGDLLSMLLNKSGIQSTIDAAEGDIDKVKGGRLPTTALKDLQTASMMMGQGGMGPGLSKLSATSTPQRVFDPVEGWKDIGEIVTPSVDPIKSFLMRNPNQFTDWLLKALQQNRQNVKGLPMP